jgi:polar amino acid transport system substrate-binding protein
MNITQRWIFLLGVFLTGLGGVAVGYFTSPAKEHGSPTAQKPSLYDRVIERGTLRVGYTIYPPGIIKGEDGKPRGIAVDVLNEVASRLNLKIEWAEEVGWATQIEGLESGRYDIIGTAVWPNAKRARAATLSKPLFYSPLYFYGRVDDTRFPEGFDLSQINNVDIRISALEGATAETIVKGQFPNASRVTLPQTADVAQSFLDLQGNKADLVITEPYQAKKFFKANPGVAKNVLPNRPLRVFGNSYMFMRNETAFENMLNTVLEDLHQSGFIDERLRHYEAEAGLEKAFDRVAPPYILSQ